MCHGTARPYGDPVPTGPVHGYNDVPKTTILIQSVRSVVPDKPKDNG